MFEKERIESISSQAPESLRSMGKVQRIVIELKQAII